MKHAVIPFAILCMCLGCDKHRVDVKYVPVLCECFSVAAYECVRAQLLDDEGSKECCGKCGGTGKVRSGDGLALVDCPCPPECPCKKKSQCTQGGCRIK